MPEREVRDATGAVVAAYGWKDVACPGCPGCADAAEWHRAIMEEPCEGDVYCTCVPVLRKAVKEQTALLADCEAENVRLRKEIARLDGDLSAAETTRIRLLTEGSAERRNCEYKFLALQAATRKVVEALDMHMDWVGAPPTGRESFDSLREDAWTRGTKALADRTIVALGGER